MARFSAALYLAADNEPHEIPIFSSANYSLNVDLHLRTNLQQYIAPFAKLLYDYSGKDFHLFTILSSGVLMNGESCSSTKCHWFYRQKLVIVPVYVLLLHSLHHYMKHSIITKLWGYEMTRYIICRHLLLWTITVVLRTVSFFKCQTLFKIDKHLNLFVFCLNAGLYSHYFTLCLLKFKLTFT